MSVPYKILFKYPSRGREKQFFEGLDSIINNLYDKENYHISCTLDDDDVVMRRPEIVERIKSYQNVSVAWGLSGSKVDAINRDLPGYGDIIIVMSDDMRFYLFGFDQIIRDAFSEQAPDLDLLCHIPDTDAKEALATMYIAGRKFYERFGYIYNPVYYSLFCDNEIMELAKNLGKYYFLNVNAIIHLNMAYNYQPRDAMFDMQQKIGWSMDMKTFNERKANNFYL